VNQASRDDDRRRISQDRAHRCLNWLNLSVAAAQTGFGPFFGVYLTRHGWSQTDIGLSLSVGVIATMASQIPAGALVDAVPNKTGMAAMGLLGIGASALLLAIWPAWVLVLGAQILHAFASSVLGPAIATISLALIGHEALGERLGHNSRYASIGNAAAAAVLGAVGYYAPERTIFILAAALTLPGLISLLLMPAHDLAEARASDGHAALLPPELRKGRGEGIWSTLLGRSLLIFCVCSAAFYFASAAMLPVAANRMTQRAGSVANLFVSAAIILPQIIVALLSPWVGRATDRSGRRPFLLLGFAVVPLRGIVLAVTSHPLIVILAQGFDGIAGAVYGVMVPLIAADLSRRSGRLNLSMGAIGLAIGLGASSSTTAAGLVADRFGARIAFIGLTLAGVVACAMLVLLMPETAPASRRPAADPPGRRRPPQSAG